MDENFAAPPPPPEPTPEANLERGVSLVSIVAVLVILGFLYVGLDSLRQNTPGLVKSTAAGLHAGSATACRLNCLEIERTALTWSLSNPGQPITLEKLKASGLHVPDCPEGGQLKLEGRRVRCSLHGDGP